MGRRREGKQNIIRRGWSNAGVGRFKKVCKYIRKNYGKVYLKGRNLKEMK